MPTSNYDLATPAGTCKTQLFTPEGSGPWPAVIFCHDGGGPREAMAQLAGRIAARGYLVAMPDFYHRIGVIGDILPKGMSTMEGMRAIIADAELRAKFLSTFYAAATNEDNLRADVGPLLDALSARPDVRGGVGTTGYCMGGNISFRLATLFGDRIAASASFHGGGLATAAPTSPHLRAANIKARIYVAGAIEDPSFTDEMKRELMRALLAAQVDATVETYPARHGFVVEDSPSFDAAAAERHDAALESLFAATLRRS